MPLELQDIFAPLPVLERGKPIVIGAHPEGKNILYTNAKSVIVRDVKNPKKSQMYSEHKHKATVAKYDPRGNYVCSADVSGNIRIWYEQDGEFKPKKEFRPISSEIKDLEWGPEGKRIAVCGKGAEMKNAAVITADSGNNLGDITGVEKLGNAVAYKPNRPYRLAIGDEGKTVSFYAGIPFKYEKSLGKHENYVQCVRYSPDGKYFASGSTDNRVFLYDGKTGDEVDELRGEGKKAHEGSVNGLSWSPCGKELLTVSGDKSAKIWNVEKNEEVAKFVLGSETADQQYSCIWMGDFLITISLSGCINYLDRSNPEKPLRVLHGHSRPLSKIINLPSDKPHHVSGDYSGKLLMYDTESGDASPFSGQGHESKITGLDYDLDSKEIISAGFDDKVRFTSSESLDYSSATTLSLDSQPTSLSYVGNGCVVINTAKGLVLIKNKKKVFVLEHDEDLPQPICMAAHGTTIAVDKAKGGVQLYEIQGDSLISTCGGPEHPHQAHCMTFSPDGSMLAVGYESKAICVYMVCDGYKLSKELFGHSMKPTVLSWSPNSQFLASSGVDGHLRVWIIAKNDSEVFPRAHDFCFINCIAWQNDSTLLTGGDDSSVRQWSLTL